MKQYYVYFLTNWNNKTLYIGVTNNLKRRLYEHKEKLIPGFSARYNLNKLVYFEIFNDSENAISREKYLKGKTRKKKNTLVEKDNPEWKDLSGEWYQDSSAAPQNDTASNRHPEQGDGSKSLNRYIRQLALPEIDLIKQERLSQTHILMVGAGGLGAAALPYLASAGIGNITIADHDTVDVTNLHRQTIYKTAETGQKKAKLTAAYLHSLNPEITVNARTDKITRDNLPNETYDLILDGSDNFETKALLNDLSITTQTPLISASVNQWQGQIGLYEGFKENKACYRCLFPKFPTDTKNCNEAGILGTSAGIIGILQAHTALLKLLNVNEFLFLSVDLKTLRISNIKTRKDCNCPHCHPERSGAQSKDLTPPNEKEPPMVDLISKEELTENTCIIDVRQPEELEADPLPLASLHIPLPEFIARQGELPTDQPLAFICAGNIRSRQAAEYLSAKGRSDVYVLDKFSL